MPKKFSKKYFVARAAVLAKKQQTPAQIAEYLFKRYGKQLRVKTKERMERIIFSGESRIPYFIGQPPKAIKEEFGWWKEKQKRMESTREKRSNHQKKA